MSQLDIAGNDTGRVEITLTELIIGCHACGMKSADIARLCGLEASEIERELQQLQQVTAAPDLATMLVAAMNLNLVPWRKLLEQFPHCRPLRRFLHVSAALTHRPPSPLEARFLSDGMSAFPGSSVQYWHDNPEITTILMHLVGMRPDDFDDPYIVLLAAAARHGYISWTDQRLDVKDLTRHESHMQTIRTPPSQDIRTNLTLGCQVIGLTIVQTAKLAGERPEAIRAARRAIRQQCGTDNAATALVISLSRHRINWDLLDQEFPGLLQPFRILVRLLQASPLTKGEVKFLIRLIPDYPLPLVANWSSQRTRPATAAQLMGRCGLHRKPVADPYMMLLAAATYLGSIQWFGGEVVMGTIVA